MYRLAQYYVYNGDIRYHIAAITDTEEEMSKKKIEIAKELNDIGVEALEIIATKNINSLREILREIDVQVFQVLKDCGKCELS